MYNSVAYVIDVELTRLHDTDNKRHFTTMKRGGSKTRYKKVSKQRIKEFILHDKSNCLK